MMWLRVILIGVVLCAFAPVVHAQDPQINITSQQDEVIVGQPYILRVEVLVPTFMPEPPVFPTFEVPGLIVRLPERSTSPVSRQVEGDTWSGVQRTYRIYPMQAGVTEIPPQTLSIVFKDTATNEDVSLTVDVPATQIVATVPPGARTLDPLILAQGLEIEQNWQLDEGELAVGDAVVRQLEISVAGTSALFVPPLLEGAAPHGPADAAPDEDAPAVAGFLPYPEDARVTETMERGVMSGTRTETVSYIAQSGGTAEFPQIVLSWYNLESGEIEEIVLDGRTVTVAVPPRVRTAADIRKARRGVLLLVLVAGLGWAAHRWLWPVIRPRLERIGAWYHASAHAAHREAERAAADADLSGLIRSLDLRAARGHPASPALMQALEALTRAIYRDGKTGPDADRQWQGVRRALRRDKPRLRDVARGGDRTDLVPLNPFS